MLIAHGKKIWGNQNGNAWKKLKDGILNDELPRDRTKYVRFLILLYQSKNG